MYKWFGRVALVTGASTSVGLSICENLVQHGMTVCALAKKSGVAKLDVNICVNFTGGFFMMSVFLIRLEIE